MPLATHPNATYEIVLTTDIHLSEDERPVFVFRYVSVIEWEKIAKLNDKFESTTDAVEMINLAFEVIKKTLCSWRNMKTPNGQKIGYKFKNLKSMVTLGEATELMMAAVGQRPSVKDKKKLDLPSALDMAGSARDAKDLTNAETSRQ